MNVADQLQQIRILLTDDRFIAIPEKGTIPFVPPIVGHGVSGHELSHHPAEGHCRSLKKQMKMVWEQRPCVAMGTRFSQDRPEPMEKIVTVFLISEERRSLDPPSHDVMNQAGGIEPREAGHGV